MLKRYEKFLDEFDKKLEEYFETHKEFISCKKGCSLCCEVGEYPFSQLEAEYLMRGFIELAPEIQKEIKRGKLEGEVKEIAIKMFREFYQFMWQNRSYWEPRLKNA